MCIRIHASQLWLAPAQLREVYVKHSNPRNRASLAFRLKTFPVVACALWCFIACEEARRVNLTGPATLESAGARAGQGGTNGGDQGGALSGVDSLGGEPQRAGSLSGGMTSGEMAPSAPLIPGPPTWARLTRPQYLNSVSDILGVDASDLELEPDTNPYLFTSIGAGESTLSSLGAERYAEAAIEIARRYFERPERLEVDLGCTPSSLEDGCSDQFVRWLGLRLYRRPLTEVEVERWRAHASAILQVSPDIESQQEAVLFGLQWSLAGMLQSPQMLYRLEVGEPDPAGSERRYTSLEMASRLAFTLQNTTPDPDLINAGLSGALVDPLALEAEIDRLLETSSARDAVSAFFAQYLDLARIQRVERDPARYPGASPALFQAMELEVQLLVDELVFRDRADIRRLFKQQRAYVNATLAAHYDLSVEGASPVVFEPIELGSDSPRVGILGLGAFLTMNAHPTETSPTLRGKYIRERLLCQEVPPPPDDIDLNLEREEGEAETLRERLELHRADPACFGCHQFIDPPGLIFESFDSVGRFRDSLDGATLDTSGEIDGVSIATAADLANFLANDPRLTQCMVRQLYRFAQGRLETVGEEGELERLHARFASGGFRFRKLLKALALSDGFRTLSLQEDLNGSGSQGGATP